MEQCHTKLQLLYLSHVIPMGQYGKVKLLVHVCPSMSGPVHVMLKHT